MQQPQLTYARGQTTPAVGVGMPAATACGYRGAVGGQTMTTGSRSYSGAVGTSAYSGAGGTGAVPYGAASGLGGVQQLNEVLNVHSAALQGSSYAQYPQYPPAAAPLQYAPPVTGGPHGAAPFAASVPARSSSSVTATAAATSWSVRTGGGQHGELSVLHGNQGPSNAPRAEQPSFALHRELLISHLAAASCAAWRAVGAVLVLAWGACDGGNCRPVPLTEMLSREKRGSTLVGRAERWGMQDAGCAGHG
eukprot:2519854-Prymnesium_polylepis.1